MEKLQVLVAITLLMGQVAHCSEVYEKDEMVNKEIDDDFHEEDASKMATNDADINSLLFPTSYKAHEVVPALPEPMKYTYPELPTTTLPVEQPSQANPYYPMGVMPFMQQLQDPTSLISANYNKLKGSILGIAHKRFGPFHFSIGPFSIKSYYNRTLGAIHNLYNKIPDMEDVANRYIVPKTT